MLVAMGNPFKDIQQALNGTRVEYAYIITPESSHSGLWYLEARLLIVRSPEIRKTWTSVPNQSCYLEDVFDSSTHRFMR